MLLTLLTKGHFRIHSFRHPGSVKVLQRNRTHRLNIYKEGSYQIGSQATCWVVYNSCFHTREAGNLIDAQSLRLDTSAILTWYWRSGGFLENSWTSVHIGRQKSWIQMSVKDGGGSSGSSNRVGALSSKGPRQAGRVSFASDFLICGLQTGRHLTSWGIFHLSQSL